MVGFLVKRIIILKDAQSASEKVLAKSYGKMVSIKKEESGPKDHRVIPIRTKKCSMCGVSGEVELTVDEVQAMSNSHILIQDAMPSRTSAFREMFISGTHEQCWKEMVGTVPEN